MSYPDKQFFDTSRVMFGKLEQHQVDGMNRIVQYAAKLGVKRAWLAYILGTIFHETARWMVPIREGAQRYGPDYSDRAARNAVAVIHAKRIISYNYALPDANGNSFYGRGLVQITHKENYKKFGIEDDPDRALEWDKALEITFRGMIEGLFTGYSLEDVEEDGEQDFSNDRPIINGDGRKYGKKIANYADMFYDALVNYKPEAKNEPSDTESPWPPKWWPF